MKIIAVVLVLAMAAGYVGADLVNNGHIWFWADEVGAPLFVDEFGVPEADPYIEVNPGDTITVWHIGNNYGGSWQGLSMIRAEMWWDTAVIANYGSGDGTSYVTQFYGDPAPGLGSHVTNPPGHNYGAAPDYSTPQYNHYLKVDLYYDYMWLYEGMAVVGYNIPIRPDAPLGETVIGGTFQAIHGYGWVQWNDAIDGDDPFALKIRVVPVSGPGDFDGDGDIDADDIDDLCDNMGGDVGTYDVDEDGDVDGDDLVFLIENLVEWDDGVDTGVGTNQGDFNLDGVVNATDLAIMKGAFGAGGVGYADGNANCDDVVNATDLAILKGTFGSDATTGGAVPEPLSIALLSAGGLALLRRRRR